MTAMLAGHPEPILIGGSSDLCPEECVRTPLGIDGTHAASPPVDYPDYCFPVGELVASGAADRGVVLGGSGIVSGSVVSPELRAKVRGLAEPVGRGLARLGISPHALTVIGFLIACVAAVAAGAQAWLLAGFLVIFGGVFDMFDGLVARATGTTSKAGAFLEYTARPGRPWSPP